MSSTEEIFAGGRILASLIDGIAPLGAPKFADEPVTSSTALQNDDALFLPVAASAFYIFVCYLDYEGGTQGASDIKWQWSVPALSTMKYGNLNNNNAGTLVGATSHAAAATVIAGTNGAGTLMSAWMFGSLITGGTAGTMQLQWAQNASSATATIVHAQSFLAAWQVA